jgi:hypothetical protein
VQARLDQMSPAPTTEQAARGATGNTSERSAPAGTTGRLGGRVEAPDSRTVTYNEGDVFRITVPANWRELAQEGSVTFAPEGGYGANNGSSVFTHGVQAGIARIDSSDLDDATRQLIAGLSQSNPQLASAGNSARTTIDGRPALRTQLSNVSDATGERERIMLYTTQMQDGSLFYLVGVSPDGEWGRYQPVINRVATSLRFLR